MALRTHRPRKYPGTAVVSACEKYRYILTRTWDETKPSVLFIMLNPSTADADMDDPTIEKCIRFAQKWGYGGIVVVNLYAYRSTDPDAMWAASKAGADIIGPENERYIREEAIKHALVIAAWGAKADTARGRQVIELLTRECQRDVHYIELTKDGTPMHPLYRKESLVPQRLAERVVPEPAQLPALPDPAPAPPASPVYDPFSFAPRMA